MRQQPEQQAPPVQRLRIRYAKRGRLRFTSHRDFSRAFERAVFRARIPMAYSSGFNPHPRISYAGAAPTGSASEAEYLEIGLAEVLDLLAERHAILTNGNGINAAAVADYAVLGVLAAAKRFDEVVRAHDRQEWLKQAPGVGELGGTAALVIGYGTIGRMIGDRLAAFGVAVTGVTRSGREGTLMPDAWRDRLGEFDWVITPGPNSFGSEKWEVADFDPRVMVKTNWGVWGIRGKRRDVRERTSWF